MRAAHKVFPRPLPPPPPPEPPLGLLRLSAGRAPLQALQSGGPAAGEGAGVDWQGRGVESEVGDGERGQGDRAGASGGSGEGGEGGCGRVMGPGEVLQQRNVKVLRDVELVFSHSEGPMLAIAGALQVRPQSPPSPI
jgi:hypothetical protein